MGGSINHSRSFIFSCSYHFTSIGNGRVCSSELGQVTVEKLSEQTKYIDVYIGVFVQSEGLRVNAGALLAAAVAGAISVSCLEGRGF